MLKDILGNLDLLVKDPRTWLILVTSIACVYLYDAKDRATEKTELYINKVTDCERSRIADFKAFKEEQLREYKEMSSRVDEARRDYYRTKKKVR